MNYISDIKKSPIERLHFTFEHFAADLAERLASDGPADAEQSLLTEEMKVGCTLGLLHCLDRPHRLAESWVRFSIYSDLTRQMRWESLHHSSASVCSTRALRSLVRVSRHRWLYPSGHRKPDTENEPRQLLDSPSIIRCVFRLHFGLRRYQILSPTIEPAQPVRCVAASTGEESRQFRNGS